MKNDLQNSPSVVTVVGARPQFVKAAVVSRALADQGVAEVLVHTGQHYDWEMSQAFFEGLGLPEPAVNLEIGSASHGAQTGRMLEHIEQVLLERRPDLVIVYGDTNSTLAGALAATKLHIPVAHVEAGLRSFNRRMPEEVNRVLTDHISTLLFVPTAAAVDNLRAEGILNGVVQTGDVMLDLALSIREMMASRSSEVLEKIGVQQQGFALVTIHRAENTDDEVRWDGIIDGLGRLGAAGLPVVWLVHPRVADKVRGLRMQGVHLLGPQPYLETQILLDAARVVITDSGGLQKEAAFHERPCLTVRTETEWVELVEAGVNRLVEATPEEIHSAALTATWPESGLPKGLYGDGTTADHVAREVRRFLDGATSIQAEPERARVTKG